MAFSRFKDAFDGSIRPGYSAAWGPQGAFRGHPYDPEQPRVPPGYREGGQWTRFTGRWTRVAANERDPPGKRPTLFDAPTPGAPEPPKLPDRPSSPPPAQKAGKSSVPQIPRPTPRPRAPRARGLVGLLAELLLLLIERYRDKNSPPDLFGHREDLDKGVIAATIFNGEKIYGMNSTHPAYTDADYRAATDLREIMLRDYPWMMSTSNIGETPNDALFHAEATVLLRAAEKNKGALAGQTLIVGVDKLMCPSCETLLPYIGLALGNPTVTFIDRHGTMRTMRNGAWVD